ncbi:unannotated protein [freshwater metagenome]|uniref:Unannotated protein n=1 Tax=freshwater metagenome TaxID=449393 RepID=A0A6J7S449_9ZZZZ|nr:hypothetical protein [Actinomycetota bacterium]MSW36718.1 hypothetical protein [Actinomycetota bacterium]
MTDSARAARRRSIDVAALLSARTSRRRALIVSGVVIGLLAAIVVAWAVIVRPSADPAIAVPSTSPTSTQPTMLFQVKSAEGLALDSALLSTGGPSGRANVIMIPSTMALDVATGGTMPFGEIARLPDLAVTADALSDAIGVTIDATVALDTLGLSALVDAVGGVVVDVDVPVMATATDGTDTVLIPVGSGQLLQGPAAAAFATYLAPDEADSARSTRFRAVLERITTQLPSDRTKVEAIFTGLGASAKASVSTGEVADFFVGLRAAVLSDDIAYRSLPVTSIDTGGSTSNPAMLSLDNVAAAAMVAELLPGAMRTPGANSQVRVFVENGVGSPGLNTAARTALVDAGFTFVNGRNAPSFDHETTEIVIPDAGAAARAWGQAIAMALKVPATSVRVASVGQSVADVIVVLGADFIPPAA